jgi:hypothetical protein
MLSDMTNSTSKHKLLTHLLQLWASHNDPWQHKYISCGNRRLLSLTEWISYNQRIKKKPSQKHRIKIKNVGFQFSICHSPSAPELWLTLGPAHCWLARDFVHGSRGTRWGGGGAAGLASRSSFSQSTNLRTIYATDVEFNLITAYSLFHCCNWKLFLIKVGSFTRAREMAKTTFSFMSYHRCVFAKQCFYGQLRLRWNLITHK